MSNYDEFTLAWVIRTGKVNATLTKMRTTEYDLIKLSKLTPLEYCNLKNRSYSVFDIKSLCLKADSEYRATIRRTNDNIVRIIWMLVNIDSGRRDESWRAHLNIAKENLELVKITAENNIDQIKYLFSPVVRLDVWTVHYLNIKSSLQTLKDKFSKDGNIIELRNWLNQAKELQANLLMLIAFMDGYFIPEGASKDDMTKIVSKAHASIVDLDEDIKIVSLSITTSIMKLNGSFKNFFDTK